MRSIIADARCWVENIPLTRPYTIAAGTTDAVRNAFVRLETEGGLVGLGAAAPSERVTGETMETCLDALEAITADGLVGRDVRTLPRLYRELSDRTSKAPAARAAADIALHDLFAQLNELPLVDVLGRAHDALPTSITIGIKATEEAIAEAEEYLGRGFSILKVKLGHDVDEDVERVTKLREVLGVRAVIRVDANQGWTVEDTVKFVRATDDLDIEFIEQPLPAVDIEAMRQLPVTVRTRIAADETLHSSHDALDLIEGTQACGIFNIKLMKCGGISEGMNIARIAETADVKLMWGCMDESRISIAAALHAAFASPTTRYLDLDGHLDLAHDVAEGGFTIENGVMRTLDKPGLGVTEIEGRPVAGASAAPNHLRAERVSP